MWVGSDQRDRVDSAAHRVVRPAGGGDAHVECSIGERIPYGRPRAGRTDTVQREHRGSAGLDVGGESPRVGERRHRLLWAVHHALVDGWSGILVLDQEPAPDTMIYQGQVVTYFVKSASGEGEASGSGRLLVN